MSRRLGPTYENLMGLEEERFPFNPRSPLATPRLFDPTSDVPAVDIEKMVYNLLVKLRVRFQFQYNWFESKLTSFKESGLKPDFILPDFGDTIIEIFPTYFHRSTEDRDADLKKKAYALMFGYTVIENGIPQPPSGPVTLNSKYVIWWENDVRSDLDHIMQRDLPEVLIAPKYGDPDEILFDKQYALDKMNKLENSRIANRMIPKTPTTRQNIYKLNRKKKDDWPIIDDLL